MRIRRWWYPLLVIGLCSGAAPTWAQTRFEFDSARQRMVEEVIIEGGVTDTRVIEAMRATPRHEFVPLSQRERAYYDMGLPIGESQTISSPFIVAYMTESIDPAPTDRVLEIGTGSGYQAAVLSPLVEEVYTIEIVESLGRRARRQLNNLGYDNVQVKIGDGYQGWPEHAPFDKIIVTCSPESVPQALVEQLAEGGRLVIPVGERFQQTLYLFTKTEGELVAEPLRPTLFVPMTGAAEELRRVQPDASSPAVVNGDFEAELDQQGHIPGWYYARQARLDEDPEAPQGEQVVTFHNLEEGLPSRALQGFAIDGGEVAQLELSAWVRTQEVVAGSSRDMQPMVAVSFYDQERRDLGVVWLGPWRGTEDWQFESKTIRVPPGAREAILRLGLFGATGEVSFDDVRMVPIAP